MALALAWQGAEVTVLARRAALLDALLPALREAGAPRARALVADLDDRVRLEARLRDHLSEHGAIQVLINNTGGPPVGPLLQADEGAFLSAFSRHVLAAHLLTRLVLPGMIAAGYGRIVNVISLSVREPIPNLGVSNTVRGAMASWAKSLAAELPPGVTVNSVLPGYTDTERLVALSQALAGATGRTVEEVRGGWVSAIPEGRLGRAEEVASAVAFLASPAAGYLRGVSLPVDGGRLRAI